MELNKLQMRSLNSGLYVREGEDKEGRTLEGHAVVTGVETVLYEGKDYREIEIIDSNCVNPDFLKTQDIKLNLLHERNTTIARCNKGEGNLLLESRADGLHFTCEAPKCDLGDRALELVRSKVYTGCSFEFMPKDYSIQEREGKDGKTEYVVRHSAFDSLSAVTIALDPAYEQTSVKAREQFREEHPDRDPVLQQKLKEEREAKEKAEREAKEKAEREAKLQAEIREAQALAEAAIDMES